MLRFLLPIVLVAAGFATGAAKPVSTRCGLYANSLKNREFVKAGAEAVQRQQVGGCRRYPAQPKTDSCLGINELKRELAIAQKEWAQAQARVAQLEEAIAQKEIQRIQEQIAKLEEGQLAALLHSRDQRLAFFYDQRETLSAIIRNHPMCALQAQAVLDQILTLITNLSDDLFD